jgi:hypothetical protein
MFECRDRVARTETSSMTVNIAKPPTDRELVSLIAFAVSAFGPGVPPDPLARRVFPGHWLGHVATSENGPRVAGGGSMQITEIE